MTERMEDAYKHCFGHLCASGAMTMMTLSEVVKTYGEQMCNDLKDCGILAEKEQVESYIAEQYKMLKEMQNKDTDIIRM